MTIPTRRLFEWTEPAILHSIEPKSQRRAMPKRDGARNTYHCCNKGKLHRGANICPGICPGFDIGPDGKLYCSWCIPAEWESTAKTCTLQDWIKIKQNKGKPVKEKPVKKPVKKPKKKTTIPKPIALAVKKSSIVDAGLGLFTLEPIKKNQNIIQYTGIIRTNDQFEANPSMYGVEISKGRVIDAKSPQSSIARFANDCRAVNKKAGDCSINSRFVVSGETVWIRATKAIPANSEIFVSYGPKYWNAYNSKQ